MLPLAGDDDSSNPYAAFGFSLKCPPGFFPPSGVFSGVFGGRSEKELEDIETTRNALAAMWPKIAEDKQKPNPKRKQKQKPYSLSKTDAVFAAEVAVAVAEVAAAEAADAAAKAAKAASAASAASSAASKAAVTAANAVAAAKYAKSVFATATRFDNPETEPPLDDDDDDGDDDDDDGSSGGGIVPIGYVERARKALEYYKDTKGEEFEFVEIVEFEVGLLPPYSAYHINFTAKLKHVSDSCSKLFFAEIYKRFGLGVDYEVSMCMILDPASQDVMKGCGYNQGVKDMLHPRGVKFWQGPPSGTPEWDEQIRRRRSSVGAH